MLYKHIEGEGFYLRRVKEKKPEPAGLFVNGAVGALIALGLTLILLFLVSIFVVSGQLPEGLMGGMTVVTLFLGSTVGAIVAIRRNRSRALIVGLLQGATLYAITFTFGSLAPVPTLFGAWSIQLLLAALLGGVAAGLLGVKRKKRKI